jgi:hemolysin activation/secretion protein
MTSSLHAQTAPDAGSLLQQIERGQHPTLPPKAPPEFEPPAPMESLGGVTVTVKAFTFAGNTLLTSKQLAPAVAKFIGRPIGFTDLQNAAIAVATLYRQAGWVVRAYLPQQDVTGGTVTIQIVEAKLGAVRVEGEANHVSSRQVERIIVDAQPPGAPLNANALDRGLLLVGDLPGVTASGKLAEGQKQSQTDLVVSVADSAPISGNVTADNAGQRATGAGRVIGDVDLNSPAGIGDRVDLLLLGSQGSNYARVDYSLPVGGDGWRVGVNGSHLGYRVITADFEALDAHGTSTTAGLEASYPLLRSRLANLYMGLNVDDKRFDNDSAGVTTTRYSIQTASVSLYGNVFDNLGGGGANNGSLTFEQGIDDLGGSPSEAADALTTHAGGAFRKLRLTLSRQQSLTERFSLYAAVSGQLSNKNLDSSEKFYLGGADGVRAYPENEGGGAEGLLANLEGRVRLPANFNAAAFVDWGSVHINKDNNFPGAESPNTDDLKGAGVSLGWVAPFGLSVKATWARRIGTNPDPTSTGDDQDGSHIENRVWLQVSMPF